MIPGDALYRALFPPARSPFSHAPGSGERLFLRAFAGTLLVGWLALILAEAAIFSRASVLLTVGAASAGLYAIAWRRHGVPRFALSRPRPTTLGLATAALLCIAGWLAFAHPFETAVGAEDAGIYFNTGGLIAREGGIRLADPALAEFGDAVGQAESAEGGAARHLLTPEKPERYRFVHWQRIKGFFIITDSTNVVTPQFLHLFPTWLALWAAFGGGVGAMVYGAPAFGLLGVAATYALARRLFGPAAGLLAATLLTLNGLQIWFARQSLSEPLLQFLLIGALYAWALFVEARDGGDKATARGAALLAGAALGSVALTHAQFLFALLPLVPLAAWLWLGRRWRPGHGWFFAVLALLLAYATFHIARYSLGYFEGIYHHVWLDAWRDRGRMAFFSVAPIALVVIAGLGPLRARWRPLVTAPRTLRLARWTAAAGVVLVATYLYLIRPGILRPGSPYSIQGYIGAPIPPGAASALVSLGWYLSPLGLALAVAGLALLLLHDFDERTAAVLCLVAPFAALYLTGTYTQGGYIYSLRRFVPLILPVGSILIAHVALHGGPILAGAVRRPRLRVPLRALGVGAAGLLILFFLATNARLVAHREYAGVLDATRALADRVGPNDIVLFSGPRDETPKLATPLRYLFGRESWVITTNIPNGQALDDWITRQEAAGRRVHLLLSAGGGKLLLPNHRLEPVDTIQVDLLQFEKLETQKPYNTQHNALAYGLYVLRPLLPGAGPLGPLPYRVVAGHFDEPAQVQGFYNVEAAPTIPDGPPTSYRWTDGEALLRVPYPGDGRPLTLTLTLGAGPRPARLGPAEVVVGIRPTVGSAEQERQLAVLAVGPDLADYRITIPADALPPTADRTAVIHLAIPRVLKDGKWEPRPGATWQPSKYPAETRGSLDARTLHIRFARAEVIVGP